MFTLKNLEGFLLVVCCAASLAVAHPHVFADVSVVALFDKTGFVGVQNHWVYDEIYSAAMVAAADVNRDGKLSDQESRTLQKSILGPLEEQNYFNYVQVKTDFLKADAIDNFKANVKNGKLELDFVVRFAVPAATDYTMLVLVVADPTNYIQMTTDMENSDAKAPAEIDVEYFADSLDGLTLFKAFRPEIQGLYLRFKK